MLDGINDSLAHAKQLIRLLEGIPSKLNLIPFNPFAGSDFSMSPPERIEAFRLRLTRAGLFAMTRKTRGDEIAAACGQLVGRVDDRTRRLGRWWSSRAGGWRHHDNACSSSPGGPRILSAAGGLRRQ